MEPAPTWRVLRRLRIVIALLAGVLALGAWKLGAFEAFDSADKVHALLDSWGAWAYVLYVVSFVLLMPFGVPAFVWVLPAGLLWPFWVAYPLSLFAVAGGSSVGFLFARYVAREWVGARLPGRVRSFDQRFSARGLRSVILFRLVFQLGAPTHWLLGLSSVGYGTFVVGTVLGAMPAVALVAWYGPDVVRWMEMHGAMSLGILAVLVAVVAVGRRLLRARRV